MGVLNDLVRGAEFTVPKKKFARDYQEDAHKALRGRWGTAILALLIASVLMMGAYMAATYAFIWDNASLEVETEETVENALLTEKTKQSLISVTAVFLISVLIAAPVMFGYERFNLDLFKGRGVALKTLFSGFQLGSWIRSVGLYIRYLLVVVAPYNILFMIGYSGVWIGAFMMRDAVEGGGTALLVGGTALAVVGLVLVPASYLFMIVAAYKYSMCFKIFAENPDMSPKEVMQASKKLMKGNKWAFFCLHCSYIGWALLSILTCGIGFIWLVPQIRASEAAFYRNISKRRKLGLQ